MTNEEKGVPEPTYPLKSAREKVTGTVDGFQAVSHEVDNGDQDNLSGVGFGPEDTDSDSPKALSSQGNDGSNDGGKPGSVVTDGDDDKKGAAKRRKEK